MTTRTIQHSPQSEARYAPRILLQRKAGESIPNGQPPRAPRYIASEQLTKEEMAKIDEVLKTFKKSNELPLGERPSRTAAVVLHDMFANNTSDIGSKVVENKSGRNELQMGEGAVYFVDRAGAITPHRGQMFASKRPTATKYELGEKAKHSDNQDELSESDRDKIFRRVYESMPESEKQPTTIPLRPTAFSAATKGLTFNRERHAGEKTAKNDVEREHEKMLEQFDVSKRIKLGTTASWTVRAYCENAPLANLDCLKVNRLFALRDQRIPQRMNVELYRRTSDTTNKYPDAQLDSAVSIYLYAARSLGYWPELRTHIQEDHGIPGAHVDPRKLDFEALQNRIRLKVGHRPNVQYSKPISSILDGYQYPHRLQPKLLVNEPGDEFEQEADRVAEQVIRMPEPQVQRQCACGKSFTEGECSECKKKKQEATGSLQCVASSPVGGIAAPPIVESVLSSPGSPLPTTARSFMESRLGQDFSHIRVHTDQRARESAAAVQARAYTVGNNIVFGNGEHPSGDQRLLAHELTHVVQQSHGVGSGALSFLQRALPPGKDKSRRSRPRNAPPGTLPIDETNLTREEIHKIKKQIRSRPDDWVGVTPDGEVIVTDENGDPEPQGNVEDLLPGATRTERNTEQHSNGDQGQKDHRFSVPSIQQIEQILAGLSIGAGIITAAVVLAALLDPEPASKLALAGLSAVMISQLLNAIDETKAGET